jgi:hypothetical protein
MYKEEFISGYCRTQDQSRMVAVEIEDGELSVDCSYGACPYEENCTIAQRIREITP